MIDDKEIIIKKLSELKIREKEKKKFGEVFTPRNLINEMLDKLPKEVFSNKDLRWFDPAVGIGNFMIEIYWRLMDGLKDEIIDFNERKTHIISKMLYMSELNEDNIKECKNIFGKDINIYEGDTLKIDINKTFDIIVGNPPYNAPNIINRGTTIYMKFVLKSLELLKDNGYLVFVHPPGWRKPQSEKSRNKGVWEKITKENHLVYLEMHNIKEAYEIFNAGVRYDWYVLKKEKPGLTEIIDYDKKRYMIDLTEWSILPHGKLDLFKKLLLEKDGEKFECIYSRSQYDTRRHDYISFTKNETFKYTVVNKLINKKTTYIYSSTNTKIGFGIPKLILGHSSINKLMLDKTGEYGLSQEVMAFPINDLEEAELIKKALETEEFKYFLKNYCRWGNFQIDWRFFGYLKKDFWMEFL